VAHSDEATAAANAKRILTAARAAFFEAIDLRSCIEMLETSNQPDVIASIQDAKAGDAADLIRKALLGRLVIGVVAPLRLSETPAIFI
jgi:hypothetical protein